MSLTSLASWAAVSPALAFIANRPGPGHRRRKLAPSADIEEANSEIAPSSCKKNSYPMGPKMTSHPLIWKQ